MVRLGNALSSNLCFLVLWKWASAWFVGQSWRKGRPIVSLHASSCPENDDVFLLAFRRLGFQNEDALLASLEKEGLWTNNSDILQTICRDYYSNQQPDHLSRMLQQDFHLNALMAHTVRSTLWSLYSHQESTNDEVTIDLSGTMESVPPEETNDPLATARSSSINFDAVNVSRPLFKQVRIQSHLTNRSEYGLASILEDGKDYVLQAEIDEFWHEFMTRPNPYHPTANPLRNETAKVYVRHASLFLGWFLHNHMDKIDDLTSVSLCHIFEDDSVESVSILLDFVRWLREDRNIAASYEANIWRGMSKLLQYRYTQLEGKHSSTLEGRPALQQIRKWHTEAQRSAKNAPRRSNEDRKWLSWEEYLGVVKYYKQEFLTLEQQYRSSNKTSLSQEKRIAVALQRYLILAIFATVPDRQRTIRELKLHHSFVKDPRSGVWSIKHSPADYKTGKTYGERPSLQLHGLTEDIDLFLEHWRPKLQPRTDFVFVQLRTQNPLTQDSVYKIVSRAW